MSFDYDAFLQAARHRLEVLKKQRAVIDAEISKLEQAIAGFAPLVETPAWMGPEVGLTAAVRHVFRNNPDKPFLPTQVRDELLNMGMELNQQNPMAAIHQILARLQKNGDLEAYEFEGKIHFKARPMMPPPGPLPQQITAATLKQFDNNPLKGKKF